MKRKSLKIIALIITGVIFLCGTSFAVYYLIPVPISRIVEVENISSVTIVTYTPKTVLVEGHETI
jgi:flagellar basal body-associated protein FliL